MASTEALEPSEQLTQLKTALEDSGLAEGTTWYPISLKWWQVLKAYLAWDEGSTSSGAPPPAIDNSKLVGDIPGTLNKGIAEHYDYVLLSQSAWDLVYEWYGGGPAFPRKVLLRGGYSASVELHPQPLKVYTTNESGEPVGDPTILLMSRPLPRAKVIANTCASFPDADPATARLWYQTEGSSDWQLWPEDMKMEDVAANDSFTNVLLETPNEDHTYARGGSVGSATADGPPAPVDMDTWRAGLKAGDFLDAQDHEQKWYESKILEVVPAGGEPTGITEKNQAQHDLEGEGDLLFVHFMGWSSQWNSWYKRSSLRLLPLHTKVPKWRDFRANDKVEFRVGTKWHLGKVEAVDLEAKRIKLRPAQKSDKHIEESWHDFLSDDIAQAYTHIKKPRTQSLYPSYSRRHTVGTPDAPGVVGLNNLGNTCFMNSMLQCLSNSEPLTRYFLSDTYLGELNRGNVLGCGGRLAEAYGQLLKDMWGGENIIVCPTEFKVQIGQKAPQFQGYQQQDSQELMAFLMDGLHEDLNRVLKKPYVEDVDSKGRPDAVVAGEAWDAYHKRNLSVISDIFAGQLKSHVKCNVCTRESTTFDPFLSLSVPLPVKSEKGLIFTFSDYEGGPPMRYKAIVPKAGVVADLIQWYSDLSGIPSTDLIVGDVYYCKVFRFLPPERAITEIRDNDVIWMYHLPQAPGAAEAKAARREEAKKAAAARAHRGYGIPSPPDDNEADVVVCMMRCERAQRSHHGAVFDGAGDPHLVSIPHSAGAYDTNPTGKQLHAIVYKQLLRYTKPEFREKFGPESPPYTLKIIPKVGTGAATVVEPTDDPVEFPRDVLLAADWSAEQYAESFDRDQVVYCDFHESTKVDPAKTEALTLDSCFEQFSEEEQLSKTDMWYCSSCAEHRQAYKKMGLWRVPEILIVHLKRFQYSQGTFFVHRDKIDTLVDFPIEGFDLSKFVLTEQPVPPIYDLYGVSNHAGGLGGGHYTAYAKNFENGQWYDFNDSHVSRADIRRVVSRQAYVLFYKRRPASGAVLAGTKK